MIMIENIVFIYTLVIIEMLTEYFRLEYRKLRVCFKGCLKETEKVSEHEI